MRAALLCLAAALGAASSATAEPAGRGSRVPRALAAEFQAGVDAYRLGRYDDARAHLGKAIALDPTLPGPHRFLAAVAQAERLWTECIAEARSALQRNPRSEAAADTRKLHDDCRAALGRPASPEALGASGAIAVTTNVAGATIRIDGLRYGAAPLAPRRIKSGLHELVVARDGYRTAHRTIDALPGIVSDVEIVLEAVAPPPPPPASSDRPRTSVE